jgi:predicted TIM-barrel fold metal-dependent hydrolase
MIPDIIDVHTHAFPDAIAGRAVARLEVPDYKARHDGTVAGLLRSMDAAGVGQSVICSIATKPEQFGSILRWSLAVASARLTPFASVHPADPDAAAHIREVRDSGLKGLKIHPYYQDFDLAEDRLMPFYEAVTASGLVLVAHTGYDMAFARDQRASPEKILTVITRFPELRFVATHFGGWEYWGEVERLLIGKPLMMEISLSLDRLGPDVARRMALAHSPDHLLFGSDSPWGTPSDTLQALRSLNLEDELLGKILGGNAARLLR